MIFVNMQNFEAISWKLLYFVNNCLVKFESRNPFAHVWYVSLWLSAAHNFSFLLNWFSIKCKFPFPNFEFFTIKTPSVTQRLVSHKNAFKKSKNLSALLYKTIDSSNSLPKLKIISGFKIVKFWIQGNSTLWHMCKMHPVMTPKMVQEL